MTMERMTRMGQFSGKSADSSIIFYETPKTGKLGDPKRSRYSLPNLVKKFNIKLDAASFPKASCADFCITPEEDGLRADWGEKLMQCIGTKNIQDIRNLGIFLNPPGYDNKHITPWIEKCVNTALKYPVWIVGLLPAYVDRPWFSEYIWDLLPKENIYFIPGRVKFWKDGTQVPGSPFFSSMIAVWRLKR